MLTRDAFAIYRAYLWNVFLCIPDTTPLLHNVESGEGGGGIIIIITGQGEGGGVGRVTKEKFVTTWLSK